jgi:hypothetical protein
MALAAITAAPAQAQSNPFTGTWAFQTEDYGSESIVVTLSGAAIITHNGARYDIRLVAHEQASVQQPVMEGEDTEIVAAHQRCTGEADGAQFTITCEIVDAPESYAPDNFVLQVDAPGRMVGVLQSASTGQVTFTRVR